MTGGSGRDTFVFLGNDGYDTITDFTHGEDIIRLKANLNGSGIYSAEDAVAHSTTDAYGTSVELGTGDGVHVLYLSGITTALTTSDFEIV